MSREAKIILVLSTLFTIAMGFSGIFITIFIWKQKDDYFTLALYQLIVNAVTPLVFIVAGWLSKKLNGVWPLRIGTGFFILFFILILCWRNQVTQWIVLFGILFGIASGFYWLSIQVLAFDYTDTSNRDTFNGINGFITSIGGAVSPLIAAYFIDKLDGNTGYYLVFSLSLICFIVQIIVSFLLKSIHTNERLHWKKLFTSTESNWKNLRIAQFIFGTRNGVIVFVIQILIFANTRNTLSLGKITFFTCLIGAVAYLVEQKFVKPKHRMCSMILGAIFMFVAVIALGFKINIPTLIFYNVVSSLAFPFFHIPLTSASFNILSFTKQDAFRIEYIINKEIALDLGRIVSICILLILVHYFSIKQTLPYFILLIGSAQLISLYFIRKITIWEKT